MNEDEAVTFLNQSESEDDGGQVQPESMTPDEVGPQYVPQVRASGMSDQDALKFLESYSPEAKTSVGASASIPAAKQGQGMSDDQAMAFLSSYSPESYSPEQAGKTINLPAMPWYENLAKSAAAQTASSFIRQAEGFERAGAQPITSEAQINAPFQRQGTPEEVSSTLDKSITDQQAVLDRLNSLAKKKGFTTADLQNQINTAKQNIENLQIEKQQTLQRSEYSPEAQQELLQQREQMGQEATQLEQQAQGMFPYFGVNQQDTSIAAQLGRGTGSVLGLAPAMLTGPMALPIMAIQGGSEAYAGGYNNRVQELKQQGVTDQKTLDLEGHKAGSQEAIHTIPSLAAYAVGGQLTAGATSALMKGASPLVRGLVGGTAAAGVNLGISGTMRAMQGQNFMPNIEQAVPDIAFGGTAALHAGMAPSENPVVNQREAEIIGKANAQKDVPLTPEQEKLNQQWQVVKKQAADVAQKLGELPEDHQDRPALQQKAAKLAQQIADLREGKLVDIEIPTPEGDERFQPKPSEETTTTQGQEQKTGGVSPVESVTAEVKPEGEAKAGTAQPQGEGEKIGGEGETAKTTEAELRSAMPNTAFFDEANEALQRLNKEDARTNKRQRFHLPTLQDLRELINNPTYKLADKLAGIFGKKIVLYKGEAGTKINGATGVDPALKDYIFLKVDGQRPHLFTAGHELWHHIELNSPVLANSLRMQITPLIKDWAGLEAKYKAAGYDKSRFFDEHIGDFLGDAMQDPKFWNDLAKKNPKSFKELATQTVDWLNKLLYQLKDWKMGGDFTKDIQKARDMLVDGLSKFAEGKDEPVSAPEEGKGPMFQQDAEKVDEKYSQLEKNYKNGDESAKKDAEKILDEKALRSKPYVIGPIYHWSKTNNAFRVFDISKAREGFHFGTEEAANQVRVAQRKAERWGEPKVKGEDYKVYIMSDHKPIRITDSELNNATSIAYQLNEKGLLNENQYRIIEDADKKLDLEKNLVIYPNINKFKTDVSTREKNLGRDLKHPFDELTDALGYKPVFEYKNNAEDKGSLSYIATDSSQIKSAEPFTYDEQGKLIPLSERFNPEKKDIYFQQDAEEKKNKDFYSQLQRTITDKMPNKASVEQIKAIIDPAKGSGVKPDELKWSNIDGFLEGKTSVTKQEVLDYLKNEGSVKFEEKMLGKNTINRDKEAIAKEIAREVADDEGKYGEFIDPEGVDNYDELTPEQRYNNAWNIGRNDFLEEAQERIDRQEMASPAEETKYSQYILPNGENYREVVLTMPPERLVYTKDNVAIDPEETAMRSQQDQDLFWIIRTPDNVYQIPKKLHPTEQNAINYVIDKKQPSEFSAYTSSHFSDIPNYVAHMRLDERPDSEGRNGLFIEEIQSDRHQQGREKGYKGDQNIKLTDPLATKTNWGWIVSSKEYPAGIEAYGKNAEEAIKYAQGNLTGKEVADAPFRKDWSVQMFKRALRDAIASGKEWVGWTKGDTQFDRWGSSKFDWKKQPDGTWVMSGQEQFQGNAGGIDMEQTARERGQLLEEQGTPVKSYEDVLALVKRNTREGKAEPIAEKLWKRMQTEPEGTSLPRKEGMEAFYDSAGEFGGLVKDIGKYVKKWGAKVEEGSIGYEQHDLPWKMDEKGNIPIENIKTPIWKVEITPEMRKSVTEEGQPMFQQDRPTEQEASKKREEIETRFQSAPIRKTKNTIVNTFKRKPANDAISYMRDAGDNAANIYAKENSNEIANDLKREFKKQNDKSAEALSFVIEAKGDQAELANMRQKIANSPDASKKWQKKALAAIDFADNNFARLEPIADKYNQIGLHQVAQENANGIDTPVREGYVPHYQDLEEQELFGGSGTGSATGFRKMRTYDTFADSIANGIDPKSINAVDLLQKRLSSGQKSINYRSWIDSLKQTIDPASGDPIATKVSVVKRPNGSSYLDVPKGYHQETMAGQRVAVKDGYEGIFSALNDPSAWRGKGGQFIQKLGGTGKAITLGLDTYHLGRIAIWQSLIKSLGIKTFQLPIPSYKKGVTLLDHSIPELQKMIATGEIPKKWAKGLLENKRLLNLAVKTGYNIGGISDALHQEWIHKIPAIGEFNNWLFNQFQRGAMGETWLLEFQRYRNAYPKLPEADVARMVSKDLNTRFGNLGRQGLLKSKTMQDTARFLFLAPQWNEGLIRTELGAMGQTGKALLDAATGKRLFAGVLARSVGGMIVAQFIANQLINYATRGTPTWENPEEGIGAKISAWIPDAWGGPGFFLNPMSLATETTHLLLKGYERTGDALDTAINYFRSRSSVPMRPVWDAVTKKNVLGTYYAPGQMWKGMLEDAIPYPIAGGTIYAAVREAASGEPSQQFAGQYQKQLFQTFGVKLEGAPSDESRLYTLANHFKLDNNIQDREVGHTAKYGDLNRALMLGNMTNAKNAMQKLLESEPASMIQKYYKNSYPKMRLFESNQQAKEFLNTLNDEQRDVYDRAKDKRKDTAQKALDLLKDMQ